MIIQICVKLMLIWIFWLDANIESKRVLPHFDTPSCLFRSQEELKEVIGR